MAKIAGVYASIQCSDLNGNLLFSMNEDSASNTRGMVFIEGTRESCRIFAEDSREGDNIWIQSGKATVCVAECVIDEQTGHAKWEMGQGKRLLFLDTKFWKRLGDGSEIIFSSNSDDE